MEVLVSLISVAFSILLIGIPILVFYVVWKRFQTKFMLLNYIIAGVILTLGVTFMFAWWSDYSNELLMEYYGYNFNAISEAERFAKVDIDVLAKVKSQEISYFGIGWPLKAIIAYPIYFSYLLIVYLIGRMIGRIRSDETKTTPYNNGYTQCLV